MEGGHTGGAHISRQRSIVSLHWGAPVGKGAGVDHLSSLFLSPICRLRGDTAAGEGSKARLKSGFIPPPPSVMGRMLRERGRMGRAAWYPEPEESADFILKTVRWGVAL